MKSHPGSGLKAPDSSPCRAYCFDSGFQQKHTSFNSRISLLLESSLAVRRLCLACMLLFLLLACSASRALGQGAKLRVDDDQEMEQSDAPGARENWFRKGRQSPDGLTSAEHLQKAFEQKLQMRDATPTSIHPIPARTGSPLTTMFPSRVVPSDHSAIETVGAATSAAARTWSTTPIPGEMRLLSMRPGCSIRSRARPCWSGHAGSGEDLRSEPLRAIGAALQSARCSATRPHVIPVRRR